MRMAIFDVDGTLTNTNDIDLRCYVRALKDTFAIDAPDLSWADYRHVTDIGITNEVLEQHFGRPPTHSEVAQLRDRLIELFDEALAQEPGLVTEIAGAQRLLDRLRASADWAVGLATGCWEASARWKLRAAGVVADDLPAAFSEDGVSREELVTAALRKTSAAHGRDDFEARVSVGDGSWDVRTAANLELAFVGVRVGGDPGALRRLGARHVLTDYADLEAAVHALGNAVPPNM